MSNSARRESPHAVNSQDTHHKCSPNDNDDEREATELGPVRHTSLETIVRSASIDATNTSSVGENSTRFSGLRRWWKHYIQLHVPHADCRDHLGRPKSWRRQLTLFYVANERTFLAYQRTSLALSMLGIVTAQLFSLQHLPDPASDPVFGYHTLGKPLAALFQSAAIVVILIGGHRFWRQQMNMARGRVWAGGWEIWSIMGFMLLVSISPEPFYKVSFSFFLFLWTDNMQLLVFVFGLLIACDASV
ncbi:hypothetical protein E4T43_02771 [Aureobasidium subglaciale]|nr:hypothetical protein E4T43_02771 [Aureobasidium subglaciale]